MQLIQNVKQSINNWLTKKMRSTMSLYMVRTSVFLENKVYAKLVEIFEDQDSQFNVIRVRALRRAHEFRSWLIDSHKLSAKGGAEPFSYDSDNAKRTFGFVALVHLLIFLMAIGLSAIYDKKVPNVTIELEDIMTAEDPPVVPREGPPPQPVKEVPKESTITQNVDAEVIKAQELRRMEKKKELEREKQLAKEREQEKRYELDRQKQVAKELEQEKKIQLDLDKQKARELEQEKKRELDRQRQITKELELEKKKQADLDRQKAKELEQEKRRELEREKQIAKELEQERKRELDRQKQAAKDSEQERRREQSQREQQQKERLAESKKIDKDGTLPPPPASPSSSSGGSSQVAQSSSSGASSSASTGSGVPMSASVSSASPPPSSGTGADSDAKASYQNNPKPPYPLVAFKMKIEGKVVLLVEVTEVGTVSKVVVDETSRNESLDRSALETVKNWKFTPAKKNGVTVAQVVRVPITFSLKNR